MQKASALLYSANDDDARLWENRCQGVSSLNIVKDLIVYKQIGFASLIFVLKVWLSFTVALYSDSGKRSVEKGFSQVVEKLLLGVSQLCTKR